MTYARPLSPPPRPPRRPGDIGRSLPLTEAAELRTALAVVRLAPRDELLQTRQLLLALRDLLTGLALPLLTLREGRLHLLLEFLHLLLHLHEEFGIAGHPGRSRNGERDQEGRSEYERAQTRSHTHLLSSASGPSGHASLRWP